MTDFRKICKTGSERQKKNTWKLINDPNYDINTYGHSVWISNGRRVTCLGFSISDGDIEQFKACLARGADPNLGSRWEKENVISNVDTPLLMVALYGRGIEYINLLVEAGALVTQEIVDKMLNDSVCPFNMETVEWCLEQGANPNFIPSKGEPTVLTLLCYRWNNDKHDECVKAASLLLKHGANTNFRWRGYDNIEGDWIYHLDRTLCRNLDVKSVVDAINQLWLPTIIPSNQTPTTLPVIPALK